MFERGARVVMFFFRSEAPGLVISKSYGRGMPTPISAKLFCKRSQVTFMSYGIVLKDERPTSNIERPTSNNDVAPLLKLFKIEKKSQYRTFNNYFCFL